MQSAECLELKSVILSLTQTIHELKTEVFNLKRHVLSNRQNILPERIKHSSSSTHKFLSRRTNSSAKKDGKPTNTNDRAKLFNKRKANETIDGEDDSESPSHSSFKAYKRIMVSNVYANALDPNDEKIINVMASNRNYPIIRVQKLCEDSSLPRIVNRCKVKTTKKANKKSKSTTVKKSTKLTTSNNSISDDKSNTYDNINDMLSSDDDDNDDDSDSEQMCASWAREPELRKEAEKQAYMDLDMKYLFRASNNPAKIKFSDLNLKITPNAEI
jgi:uncharacterized protein (UPF0147 family)